MPRLAVWADWDLFAVPEQGRSSKPEEHVTGKARSKVDRRAGTKRSVLVADDDRDVRTMLRTQFELEGDSVIEAADGDQRFVAFTAGMASYEECVRAGFDDHFLKTDPLPRLSQTVRRLLSR